MKSTVLFKSVSGLSVVLALFVTTEADGILGCGFDVLGCFTAEGATEVAGPVTRVVTKLL